MVPSITLRRARWAKSAANGPRAGRVRFRRRAFHRLVRAPPLAASDAAPGGRSGTLRSVGVRSVRRRVPRWLALRRSGWRCADGPRGESAYVARSSRRRGGPVDYVDI